MGKHLGVLALVNVAVAIGFLMPAAFWMIAEHKPAGSLNVTLPKIDRTQEDLAYIQATNDIEKLRNQAKMLTEMRSIDQKTQDIQTQVIQKVFEWLWTLLTICGSAFLLNAVAMWWLAKRPPTSVTQSAL